MLVKTDKTQTKALAWLNRATASAKDGRPVLQRIVRRETGWSVTTDGMRLHAERVDVELPEEIVLVRTAGTDLVEYQEPEPDSGTFPAVENIIPQTAGPCVAVNAAYLADLVKDLPGPIGDYMVIIAPYAGENQWYKPVEFLVQKIKGKYGNGKAPDVERYALVMPLSLPEDQGKEFPRPKLR